MLFTTVLCLFITFVIAIYPNIPSLISKTGIQGDAVPLANSKGGAFGGVWGNDPTV